MLTERLASKAVLCPLDYDFGCLANACEVRVEPLCFLEILGPVGCGSEGIKEVRLGSHRQIPLRLKKTARV